MLTHLPRKHLPEEFRIHILEVIQGNIWCNESHEINRSSVIKGRRTDLPQWSAE